MPRKIIILIGLFVLTAFGIFMLYSVLDTLIPRHGTAANISELQKVYQKAGPEIAVTFTNDLVQKFPFQGNVNWTLSFFKAPFIDVIGKVDTNALHQYINDHPNMTFAWSGVDKDGRNWFAGENSPTAEENAKIKWDRMSFKLEPQSGGYAAIIEGFIEFPSCQGTIRSWVPDRIPDKK